MASIEEIRSRYEQSGGSEFNDEGRFAVAAFSTREGKNGVFATVELRDETGNLTARSFDGNTINELAGAGAIDAKVRISTFNGAISVVINRFKAADLSDDEVLKLAGLDLEVHAKRVKILEEWLAECDTSVFGPILREALSGDETWRSFCMAPAAVKMHHAEPGGLVRHLCEVGEAGLAMLESTGNAYDRAYFLAGVFLHDIGKLDTYSMPPTIQYTAQGQMVEHQVYSVFRLGKACANIGMSDSAVEAKLIHMIEQAHGAYRHAEWQDPVGIEVKTLATADYFSSRLGTTDRERNAQESLDRLYSEGAREVEYELEPALF